MRIIYVEDNLANVALIERICHMNEDELVTYSEAEFSAVRDRSRFGRFDPDGLEFGSAQYGWSCG